MDVRICMTHVACFCPVLHAHSLFRKRLLLLAQGDAVDATSDRLRRPAQCFQAQFRVTRLENRLGTGEASRPSPYSLPRMYMVQVKEDGKVA